MDEPEATNAAPISTDYTADRHTWLGDDSIEDIHKETVARLMRPIPVTVELPTIQPHDYEGASWEVKDYIRELKLVITDLEQRLESGAQAVISLSALAEEANAGRAAAEAKVAFLEALNSPSPAPVLKGRSVDEPTEEGGTETRSYPVGKEYFGQPKPEAETVHAGGRPPERVPTAEESVVVADHIAAWGSTRFQTLADQLGISKGMAHRWVTKAQQEGAK